MTGGVDPASTAEQSHPHKHIEETTVAAWKKTLIPISAGHLLAPRR